MRKTEKNCHQKLLVLAVISLITQSRITTHTKTTTNQTHSQISFPEKKSKKYGTFTISWGIGTKSSVSVNIYKRKEDKIIKHA